MKWIGQHIWNLVSRFRHDVYVENLSEGDAGNDVINIDSDGKLHTVPKGNLMRGIDDEPVNGQTDESITSNWAYDHQTLTGNGAHVPSAGSSGQFLAYNGTWATPPDTDTNTQLTDEQVQDIVGSMFSGNTETNITATYQDADGTIDLVATDTNTQLSNAEVRAAVEAATDSNVFTDDDHTKLNNIAVEANNYSLPSANETTVGGVELATTGEADTGTDTSRAVTPAGLKSHVDARHTYVYLHIHGRSGTGNDNWFFQDSTADGDFNWETDGGADAFADTTYTTVGSSTVSLGRDVGVMGMVIPYDCTLVGFKAIGRDLSGNDEFKAGLWSSPVFSGYGGSTGTTTFTLRAVATASHSGGSGSNFNGICKLDDLSQSYSLSAGQILCPSIAETDTNRTYVSMTIVLKVPII